MEFVRVIYRGQTIDIEAIRGKGSQSVLDLDKADIEHQVSEEPDVADIESKKFESAFYGDRDELIEDLKRL